MTSECIQYNTDTDNNTSHLMIIKETSVTFIPPKQMLKIMTANNLNSKENIDESSVSLVDT